MKTYRIDFVKEEDISNSVAEATDLDITLIKEQP